MRGINIVQWLFKSRLGHESRRAVAELESVAQRQQGTAAKEIARLSKTGGAAIELGTTTWKQPVRLPTNEIANHSLIVGASGSGKSFLSLSLICQLLDQLNASPAITVSLWEGQSPRLKARALAGSAAVLKSLHERLSPWRTYCF